MLIQRVYSNNIQFTSIEDLKLKTIEEWRKIDGEIINNLYKSIKDRIFNLISSKGGITKFYVPSFLINTDSYLKKNWIDGTIVQRPKKVKITLTI